MLVLPIVTASLGCGLASPARALELGDLRMESTLGQPLRASIAYSLGANEQLYDFCIKLRPGLPGADVPPVSRATVSLTRDAIILTGKTAVKDPLLAIELVVSCPYSPRIVRNYTLMVDPVLPASGSVPAKQMAARPVAPSPAPARLAAPAPAEPIIAPVSRASTTTNLMPGDEYRVQLTDTASAIAARVQGRTLSLAVAVSELVAKNPHAFIAGDVNRLMAAAVVEIPLMSEGVDTPDIAAAGATTATATVRPRDSRDTLPPVAALPEPVEMESVAALPEPVEMEPVAALPEPVEMEPVAALREPVETVPADTSNDALKPGDIIAAAPVDAATRADNARAQTPVVRTAARAAGTASSGSAWPMSRFIGGGAGLLILGLMVFFGRPLWRRFRSKPVNLPVPQAVEPDEEITQTNPVISDVDFRFDDPIGQEPISLDADFEAGTGLGNRGEIDVAQDYGFTTSGDPQAKIYLDFEFEEDAGTANGQPPGNPQQELAVEPTAAATDEDYDVSMIIDATRQDIGDHDATAKDLKAVEVRAETESGQYAISNDTLDTEIDLKILEQDYQDEFTATMAANAEIEKAAKELAQRMQEDQTVDVTLDNFAGGATVEMPARDAGDDDTAEITASIAFEFAGNDDLADGDITAKILAAGSDVTVELPTKGNTDRKS